MMTAKFIRDNSSLAIRYKQVFVCLYFCLFFPGLIFAQDSLTLKQIIQLPYAAKYATADQLGNYYIISPENEIIKLGSYGQELFRYSDNQLGEIYSFDASNPLNLIVFYKGFNIVKVLDRTLTETGTFNLFDAGIFQASCVGLSGDNNLWAYDRDNFQLKKIGKTGEISIESQVLNLLFDSDFPPVQLQADGNYVYLSNMDSTLCTFNVLGKFTNKIEITQLIDCQAYKDKFLLLQKDKLTILTNTSFSKKEYLLPKKIIRNGHLFLKNNQIFHLKKDTVEVFEY